MHVKYLESLSYIERHYEDVEWEFENVGLRLLKTWGITEDDREDMREEREVLRYLIGCRFGRVRGKSVDMPGIELVERTFNRYLNFLERIHDCHEYNVNKHKNPMVRKMYKACRHYLFQFTLPGWVKKMPKVIEGNE